MAVLTNNTADALQEIKAAIADHVTNTDNSGNVWTRIRYADNLQQWLALAAIRPIGGLEVVRVCFVYLTGFSTDKVEFRQRKITATFAIEIIQSFIDGTDGDNSTMIYERFLGSLEEAFSQDQALGFTDAASQEVTNSSIQAAPGENEGKPVYVDGILAHRSTATISIEFRMC